MTYSLGSVVTRLKRFFRAGDRHSVAPGDQNSAIGMWTRDDIEIVYRKGTADEDVLRETIDQDLLFSGVQEYTPRKNDVIVDVGAHIGTFAVMACVKCGDCTVHAIEPSEDSWTLLRVNSSLNRRGCIVPHHLALSDVDGSVRLFHDQGNWGHSTVARLSSVAEDVPALSLDSFLSTQQISRCNFMKLNCEGAEFPILLSAKMESLKRIQVILVLYHKDLWTAHTEADIVSLLETSGMSVRIVKHSPHRGWIIGARPAVA